MYNYILVCMNVCLCMYVCMYVCTWRFDVCTMFVSFFYFKCNFLVLKRKRSPKYVLFKIKGNKSEGGPRKFPSSWSHELFTDNHGRHKLQRPDFARQSGSGVDWGVHRGLRGQKQSTAARSAVRWENIQLLFTGALDRATLMVKRGLYYRHTLPAMLRVLVFAKLGSTFIIYPPPLSPLFFLLKIYLIIAELPP